VSEVSCPGCGAAVDVAGAPRPCPACGARVAPVRPDAPTAPALDPRSVATVLTEPRGPAAARSEPAPARIGPYAIERELGRGGLGVVYLGRADGGPPVAIKVLLAGDQASLVDRARFAREAESAQRLDHPGIVQVHEQGADDDILYIAMDYVDGSGLDEVLRRLRLEEVVAVLTQVAEAVGHAHAHGVVHRDLKPANVLIRKADGRAVVADFGLARVEGARTLTTTGQIMGTPHYLAPEQADDSKRVTPATDVYALGAILYEGLTGRPPFDHVQSTPALLRAVLVEPPRPPSETNHRVPRVLEAVCMKALAKAPPDRFPDGAALAAALEDARAELWGRTASDLGPVAEAAVAPAPDPRGEERRRGRGADADEDRRDAASSPGLDSAIGWARWGVFGALGVSLLSVAGCCLATGALCLLPGGPSADEELADLIEAAPLLDPAAAAGAAGLVCVQAEAARVDSALVVAGDVPCLYVDERVHPLETTTYRRADGTVEERTEPAFSSETTDQRAVASFAVGALEVDPDGARYLGLDTERVRTARAEHVYSVVRADRPLLLYGTVQDGVLRDAGGDLVVAQDVDRAELLEDLRSAGFGGFVGRAAVLVGAVLLVAAITCLILSRGRR